MVLQLEKRRKERKKEREKERKKGKKKQYFLLFRRQGFSCKTHATYSNNFAEQQQQQQQQKGS